MEYIRDFALPELLKSIRSINEKVLRDFVLLILLVIFIFQFPYKESKLVDLTISPNSVPGITICICGLFFLTAAISAHFLKLFATILYIDFLIKSRAKQAVFDEAAAANNPLNDYKHTGIDYADYMTSSILSDNVLTEILISGNGRLPSLRLLILLQLTIFLLFIFSMKLIRFNYFPHLLEGRHIFKITSLSFLTIQLYLTVKIVYLRCSFWYRTTYFKEFFNYRLSIFHRLRGRLPVASRNAGIVPEALSQMVRRFGDFTYSRNFYEDPQHVTILNAFNSNLYELYRKIKSAMPETLETMGSSFIEELEALPMNSISREKVSALYNFLRSLGISLDDEKEYTQCRLMQIFFTHALTSKRLFT